MTKHALVLVVALLAAACGADTPTTPAPSPVPAPPSGGTPTVPVTLAVCTAIDRAYPTLEGPHLVLELNASVAGVRVDRQQRDAFEKVEDAAIHQDSTRQWHADVWFNNRYWIRVTCANGAVQETFVTVGPPNPCGGCPTEPVTPAPTSTPTLPPTPTSSSRPATCSLSDVAVTWDTTSEPNHAHVTLAINPGLTGSVTASLRTEGSATSSGPWTVVHENLPFTVTAGTPANDEIHLIAGFNFTIWRVTLTCAGGAVLDQRTGTP